MAQNAPFIPRTSKVLREGGYLGRDYDKWLQSIALALDALSTTILSGPDADPNGVVVGSPGYLYRALGDDVTTSKLYMKESGVQTDTGWVLK